MGIPVFMSKIVPLRATTPTVANSWWVRGNAGTQELFPATSTTPYYFLATNKSSAGAGRSLLTQLKALLDTSSGVTWTVTLTSDLKLKFVQSSGGSIDISSDLGWMLGFDTGPTHLPSDTVSVLVLSGSTGYTAPYRSPWLWCPEERVSFTEPTMFDPMTLAGIKTSAGSVSRAQDGTGSYTSNGIQVDAVFGFRAIEGMYRARANYSSDNVHQREDFETWWQYGPGPPGRSFLFWRDKSLLIGTATPAAGSAAPYNYVEYNPSVELHGSPTIAPTVPDNLLYWDARVGGFLTRRGEQVYS